MSTQASVSIGTQSVNPEQGFRAGGKFLTFFLAEEEYGLEILKVQEIMGLLPVTPVPRTPPFIRGVINLRGKVIPVVDLRSKFGMVAVEETDETCIIVVEVQGLQMGIVVDRVSEVLDIAGLDIEPPPSFGTQVDTGYILGIGKTEERIRVLLDIDLVLSPEEVTEIRSVITEEETEG